MDDILREVEAELKHRGIDDKGVSNYLQNISAIVNRRIIGGYASVDIIDREKQRIPLAALEDTSKRFMANPFFRLVTVFHCLSPETPILTQNSNKGKKYVPISEITVGDKVFTHTGKSQRVLNVIEHDNNGPALELTLSNKEVITVTSEHPILTRDRGWVKAGELTTDDVLLKLEHPNTFKGKTLEEIYGVDGTNILKIESIWYTGKVYNLEIAVDHTYSGKGIIYHNSDVVVGRVLPKWTHPLTGETFSTHMDKMGWWVVCEVRNDLEIANKVWTEIRKGNLRSFSIAGSSRDKVQKVQNGVSFEQVNDLDTCEVAICSVKNTKIWTKRGLIPIQDVNTDDYAYTHMNRWRKVVRLMNREISDGVMKITTENGVLEFTPNHPFRVFKGNKYIWTPTSDLKIGDQLSMHEQTGSCSYCGTPLFKKLRGTIYENYCCSKCHSSAPENRKGQTILSGDSGAISQSNKMKGKPSWNAGLNVDCLTDEQRERQIISCTSTEFREKRSKIQKEKWLDAQYRESQIKASHHNSTMNKAEDKINNFLQTEFPNEWKYVGSGEVWIGTKNPDFININGQKKIIEFWGEYWHRNHSKQDRIDYFKEYGYETLIVSDKDLNYVDTIKEFCGNKLSKIISIEKQAYSGLVYNLEVSEDNSYTTEFAVVHNCEIPVNSGSHFDVLWDPEAINIFGY